MTNDVTTSKVENFDSTTRAEQSLLAMSSNKAELLVNLDRRLLVALVRSYSLGR